MPEVTLDELGGWPVVLGRLMRGEDLTSAEASAALTEILAGRATSAQIAAFATALRIKGETVEEMSGLVATMFEFTEQIPVRNDDLLDTCGTGGGAMRRSGSFNVSTIASFVIAGAGGRVCKHGNRRASSTCGSFDLLEALGVAFDLGPDGVARCIDEVGIGFCFAPRYHSGMRHAGPTRREIGVPTVFNFLGPLANPARPRRQVIGVSDPTMAERMARVLQANGATRAMVVYGHDGLDELTTTTSSTVVELADGEFRTYVVEPSTLGLAPVAATDIVGGDAARNADLAAEVLGGLPGPHRDIVLLNAAAGLVVAGLARELTEGIARAAESIDSGRAAEVCRRLIEVSQVAAAG